MQKSYFISILIIVLVSAETVESVSGFTCGSPNMSRDKPNKRQVCLPPGYSKFELPNPYGVNPIRVELLIQDVLSIDDKDHSITFSCYYNMYWKDNRIRFSSDHGTEELLKDQINDHNSNFTLKPNVCGQMNPKMLDDLWVPNTMIYNLKSFEAINVLDKSHSLWIMADKSVLYSTAAHITFVCPMNYHKFPFDTHTCKFQIGSYSYDDSQMTFTTLTADFEGKSENSIPLDYAVNIRNLSAEDSILILDGLGNFSLAGFEMVLDRHVSTYIFTHYLPSGLFVIISWASFLISVNVIPVRMILLLVLFLVLVNIHINVTTYTPKAEGPTAIAVWMQACILFVFGALIEYVAILIKNQLYVTGKCNMKNHFMSKDKLGDEVKEMDTKCNSEEQMAKEYQWIDRFSMIAFPIVFLIFNVFYWLAFVLLP